VDSNGEYRAIFEANPDALVVTRVKDQKLIDVNRRFHEITGYTREEALNLTSADLGAWSNPEDRSTFWSLLEESGRVRDFEFGLRTKSGELKVGLISGMILSVSGQECLISVFKDITDRKRAEESLDSRLRFEQLLMDLSSRFTNLPPEQVDQEIDSGLKAVREFLVVDRVGMHEVSEDRSRVRLTHGSLRESLSLPFAFNTDVVPRFPWLFKHIVQQGNIFCAQSLEDYPPEGAVDKAAQRQLGIEASLTIPLSVSGVITHLITINDSTARSWPEEYIPRLRLLGEVFANALARRRADEERRRAFQEIKELKDRLQEEAHYLSSEMDPEPGDSEGAKTD
jgi:PAS domain S-box-containing protein